jgi:peptide/nickel transport system permease protein
MAKYIARRFVQAIPTLFLITVLSFMIVSLAPGGPTASLLLDPNLTPQDRVRIAEQLGVNDPWPIQYLRWLIGDDWEWRIRDNSGELKPGTRLGILRLDFGHSFVANRRVLDLFAERLGATLELGISALLFALFLGVPIGILSAVVRGSLFDNSMRVLAVIINAVPNFWLGLMLILLFGVIIKGPDGRGLLPMGSRCPTTLETCPPLHERLNHLILPMVVLGGGGLAGYSRYLRASMLDVIGQDYIRTARAKGLKDRTVWFAHGARNALIPLATFLGPAIAGVWGGAFITEQIFSWPGIGRLTLQSLTALDYPMIMAVTVFSAVATILGFIISDILYALIDPRIRFN